MTVIIRIGRRVSKVWYRRMSQKVIGLMSFQQNIWLIISQSMNLAKRKANEANTLDFVLTKKKESEDLHYDLEWIEVIIKGTKEQEEEEYKEANGFYENLGKLFKKDMPKDLNMEKHFKTELLSTAQVSEAYKKGYGAAKNTTIAQKLLEMGILTHIELIPDWQTREIHIK